MHFVVHEGIWRHNNIRLFMLAGKCTPYVIESAEVTSEDVFADRAFASSYYYDNHKG